MYRWIDRYDEVNSFIFATFCYGHAKISYIHSVSAESSRCAMYVNHIALVIDM